MLVTSSARLRFVSIPPRKMRLVADSVKGMPVQKALDILTFTPKLAAQHVAKTVKSAAANALSQEGTDRLKPEDLHIKNVQVDAAPTAKRIRFRSMGRVYRYKKRFCHLTVLIEGEMAAETTATQKRKAKVVKKQTEADAGSDKPQARKSTKAPTKKTAKKVTKQAAAEVEAKVKVTKKSAKSTEAPEKKAAKDEVEEG
ncbi:MAG: 50S ribosomal protein L22 [bacterium]